MESKDLTVVIVTFKSEAIILNCLKSISKEIPVIIVENSSNKTFQNQIENQFSNVNCILTGENKGYSVANNIGLKRVKTKYALVLNPDTVLDTNAINNFLSTAKNTKDFWLIGPANDQMKKLDFEENNLKEVNNMKGFAIFFNLSKFNKEFFDENFFLFFEEIDLCKKVKINNGKIYLDKKIIIKHEGAKSVDIYNIIELEKNRNWHWMWSTFYFHKKYKGFLIALIIIFPKLISSIIKFFIYMLIFKKFKSDIYKHRILGIINSVILKKSWYRPRV